MMDEVPTLLTLFNLYCLFKGPISKHSHIGSKASLYEFGVAVVGWGGVGWGTIQSITQICMFKASLGPPQYCFGLPHDNGIPRFPKSGLFEMLGRNANFSVHFGITKLKSLGLGFSNLWF